MKLPASTSNCGPGFDTLSIALCIYNFCRVEIDDGESIRAISGEWSEDYQAMVEQAGLAFYQAVGIEARNFSFEIWGEIPSERGLGSSATIRTGVVAGLNNLLGQPLDDIGVIRLVAALDNAPDNASAVVRGGFLVSRLDPARGSYVDSVRFAVSPELRFVVASPDIRVRTLDARKALPKTLDFSEVVQSLNSLAYLVALFSKAEYGRLAGSTTDHIHQPFRRSLNPFVDEAIAAGVDAGAYTGWLSGSGSSVVCLAPEKQVLAVGQAMLSLYENNGIRLRIFQTRAENQGLQILQGD